MQTDSGAEDIGRTLKTGNGCVMLYDAGLIDHPEPALFSAGHWHGRDSVRPAGGRGGTWFITSGGSDWVLRRYRRGGAMRWLGDRYLRTGAEHSRPFREWRYLNSMRARNLPVPRPVAALVEPAGPWYRGALITQRIAPAVPLAAWLQKGEAGAAPWMAVGRTLALFHASGAAHPDLNAHNILVGAEQDIHLIDFDRGGWREPGGAWARRNLERLKRSLFKLATADDRARIGTGIWPELLRGYAA